jgi:hypothetical protein
VFMRALIDTYTLDACLWWDTPRRWLGFDAV